MNLDFSAFERAIDLLEGKRLKITVELEDTPAKSEHWTVKMQRAQAGLDRLKVETEASQEQLKEEFKNHAR